MTKGKRVIALAICAAMALSFAACDDSGKKEETDSFLGGLIGGTDSDGEKTSDNELGGAVAGAMLGYVVSSRVTSAATVSAELTHAINCWLVDIDVKGYGMKLTEDNVFVVYMSFADGNSGGEDGGARCVTSDIAPAYNENMWKVTDGCADGEYLENTFEDYMSDYMPDTSGSAAVVIRSGACRLAIFTPDSDGGTPSDMAASEIQERISSYMLDSDRHYFTEWSSGTPGIGDDGKIYGIYPQV